MNWIYIGWKLLQVFLIWASITGSYFLSKEMVISNRLKKDGKATLFEKSIYCFKVIGICLFIACMISFQTKHETPFNPVTIIAFISLVIPCLCGLDMGLQKDAKMSPEERLFRRLKEKNDENTFSNIP